MHCPHDDAEAHTVDTGTTVGATVTGAVVGGGVVGACVDADVGAAVVVGGEKVVAIMIEIPRLLVVVPGSAVVATSSSFASFLAFGFSFSLLSFFLSGFLSSSSSFPLSETSLIKLWMLCGSTGLLWCRASDI